MSPSPSNPVPISNLVRLRLGEKVVAALVDTGAERSLLSARELPPNWEDRITGHPDSLVGVDGKELQILGKLSADLYFGDVPFSHEFIVVKGIQNVLILGHDFLCRYRAVIDYLHGELSLLEDQVAIPLQSRSIAPRSVRVLASNRVKLQPRSENHLFATIVDKGDLDERAPGVIEPRFETLAPRGLVMANALALPRNRRVPVSLINANDFEITLQAGSYIADFLPVEAIQTVRQENSTDGSEPMKFDLDHLSPDQREKANELLASYRDIMMEPGKALGQTTLVRHHINVGDASPVKQRWRRIPPHQYPIVEKAVEEMLADDIIRPSHSAWSSPIVLVRKVDNSVRFCVDYRVLNERSFKDAYPLTRLTRLPVG